MDLVLHLGAHRCATTTFQSYLWANRRALAAAGLTCWTPRRTRDGLMRGLMRHPALIEREDERAAIGSVDRIRVELNRLANANQRAVLISEENMIGSMANNVADARLYPLLRERLSRFGPAFKGHKLRIGLSVRSYEDFWTSSLTHLVALGYAKPSPDDLEFLTMQPRRWRSIVRDIAACFPEAEIVVWQFEHFAADTAAQLRLLWPNGGVLPAPSDEQRNQNLGFETLNEVLALRGERSLESGSAELGSRWMPFTDRQRNVLGAQYRRDLAWLKTGAEGLARFEGTATPHGLNLHDGRQTPALETLNRQAMPAARPDGAEDICDPALAGLPFGGQIDGFKEGLGRAGPN